MLTLDKDDPSTPVVGIYHESQKNPKKPSKMVYFSHQGDEDRSNTADAEGVLHLHRQHLKKKNQVNDEGFSEVCKMLDEDLEPDQSHPLRAPYWAIRDSYERFLQREMFLGDEPEMWGVAYGELCQLAEYLKAALLRAGRRDVFVYYNDTPNSQALKLGLCKGLDFFSIDACE